MLRSNSKSLGNPCRLVGCRYRTDTMIPGANRAISPHRFVLGWLGSRVVSVLDSGAEGPELKSQPRRCLRLTVHTHCASVHQAAKLVAALLRFAGVTAGLAERNGSLQLGL